MIIHFGSSKYKHLTMNDIVIPGHPVTEYRFTKNFTNIMCLPIFFTIIHIFYAYCLYIHESLFCIYFWNKVSLYGLRHIMLPCWKYVDRCKSNDLNNQTTWQMVLQQVVTNRGIWKTEIWYAICIVETTKIHTHTHIYR